MAEWEAIGGTLRMVSLLDEEPGQLAAEYARARCAYAEYLRQRRAYYDELGKRFGPGFWIRRTASPTGPRSHRTGEPV